MATIRESGDSAVYSGFWFDHNNGPFLTLTNARATALITFLAVSVTFAGNRSWKIFRFVLYQLMYPKRSEARLEEKRTFHLEAILRNVVTAGSTLWALVELALDARLDRKASQPRQVGTTQVNKEGRKLATLGVVAAIHFVLFIAAGILTSRIVVGRLVVSRPIDSCGQWRHRGNDSDRSTLRVVQSLRLNETLDADNYVRNCYPLGSSRSILDCGKFVTRSLPFQLEHNARCPFNATLCSERPDGALLLDSGLISFRDLGINSKFASSMFIQRRSVCAVVPDTPFLDPETLPISDSDRVRSYLFYLAEDKTPRGIYYLNHNGSGTFDLQAWHLNIGPEKIVELIRPTADDHDPSLIFLRSNGVWFAEKSDDPWFSAHTQINFQNQSSLVVYETDHFVNIIACKESVRFCRSKTFCAPWTGLVSSLDNVSPATLTLAGKDIRNDTAEMEELQSIYSVVALSAYRTSIPNSIQGRPAASALQSARYLNGITQEYLAPEQWKLELQYWFAMALARLQLELFNTIEKSPGVDTSQAFNQWEGSSLKSLCGRVKFHSPNYTTMSTTGIAVILGFVSLLIILSFADVILAWIPAVWARRLADDWQRLETLQLLTELEGWWSEIGGAADPLQINVETK